MTVASGAGRIKSGSLKVGNESYSTEDFEWSDFDPPVPMGGEPNFRVESVGVVKVGNGKCKVAVGYDEDQDRASRIAIGWDAAVSFSAISSDFQI